MKKALTIVAASALALGAAACHKSGDGNSANVSADDNMLVPADENSMGGADLNGAAPADNLSDANATADNGAANASNAM